ncbi:MAG: DNA polymerase II large subunit [Methanomassiliicoccales archaeon]|nr:MAG: DNA polymerase II large subunit [Methanomassiliicoccales archaeon]
MKAYFEALETMANECYEISERARLQGKDPEVKVEIPKAEDLAMRVEKLLDFDGIAHRIRALTTEYNREEASLGIAKEIVISDKMNREKALERAIRVGLAVLTEGILVAPLEGVADVKIHGKGSSSYVSVYYAGPIRSAGGTGQAMSVLIADVVRRELGIGRYKPTRKEIERYKEEMALYKTSQYTPTNDEIDLIIKNCPICIDGEGTEEDEVSGNRDLQRVATNRVRGGALLVLAEGLCLKASKIQRLVKKLKIDGWEFIDELVSAKSTEVERDEEERMKVEANYKFIKDIVAGRPVLCHPSRVGGFRLRYGRSRASGLAAISIHPAAMTILDDFISVGTQIKIERPGKAGAVTPCDSIEPPVVLLENGDLIEVEDGNMAQALKSRVSKIVDLGEVLIPYGEFIENNHILIPGAYCKEWWLAEFENSGGKVEQLPAEFGPDEAFRISEEYSIPLHPNFNLLWHDITTDSVLFLREYLLDHGRLDEGNLILPFDEKAKDVLISLGALHTQKGMDLVVGRHTYPLIRCLGLAVKDNSLEKRDDVSSLEDEGISDVISLVSSLSGVTIRERAPNRIGARMARPEKAKERKMRPPPHVLFPLGEYGGAQRLVSEALKKGVITVDVGIRECTTCRKRNFSSRCECGGHTKAVDSPTPQKIDLDREYRRACANLGESNGSEIKGVRGMISKNKTPEPLEKGILRQKHEVFVFKDGTIRFDMTDVPVTHIKPSEIGLSVDKAKELGYNTDYKGEPLENGHQLIELKPQDIIPSIKCGKYLVRVSKFMDDLLTKFYDIESFYNASAPEDLIGHLVVGLAPHTSGGVLARIIGYTKAQVGYAHPFFHAAKRRNCDGDEDCVMLLLDGLIDFSRAYLPESRGGMMDAPLVLTTRINPDEIDKEAHNLDVLFRYPLGFYEATMHYSNPKDVEKVMDIVAGRIGEVGQYEGFGFTHDTKNIGEGPPQSAYKTLKTMMDKMDGQLSLARKIRAVDTDDVVARVINNHFLPDMIGNLKRFSTQQVRCTKCNKKFRRMPLMGKCSNCEGNLTLTVHEGSVKKYLEVSKEIVESYDISNYTKQRIRLVDGAISSLFENEKVKECTLEYFF